MGQFAPRRKRKAQLMHAQPDSLTPAETKAQIIPAELPEAFGRLAANVPMPTAMKPRVEAMPAQGANGADRKYAARAKEPEALAEKLAFRTADKIKIKPVEWLWSGRIAMGKHTAIAGEPGIGKSQLL